MERIYLDNASTTKINPIVWQEMSEMQERFWANASAQYTSGRLARGKIEQCRKSIANGLQVDPNGIVFTSGATEANNFLIRSNAYRLKKTGRGNHIITSMAEHPSVFETCKQLEKEGFEVDYLPLNEAGVISLEDLEQAIRPDTILVSVMTVNNETGIAMPIAEIASLIKEQEIFFHTDFVQAMGKVTMRPGELPVDAFSITAHKIHGPKGIGIAYQKPSISLESMLHGGHQENEKRAGTESLLLIAGLSKAAELLYQNEKENQERIATLAKTLHEELLAEQVRFDYNSDPENFIGIQNIWFHDVEASQALIMLDLKGIEVSAGSACAAGSLEPSRILKSMFGDSPRTHQSLRISFSPQNTEEEIRRFAKEIAYIQRQV